MSNYPPTDISPLRSPTSTLNLHGYFSDDDSDQHGLLNFVHSLPPSSVNTGSGASLFASSLPPTAPSQTTSSFLMQNLQLDTSAHRLPSHPPPSTPPSLSGEQINHTRRESAESFRFTDTTTAADLAAFSGFPSVSRPDLASDNDLQNPFLQSSDSWPRSPAEQNFRHYFRRQRSQNSNYRRLSIVRSNTLPMNHPARRIQEEDLAPSDAPPPYSRVSQYGDTTVEIGPLIPRPPPQTRPFSHTGGVGGGEVGIPVPRSTPSPYHHYLPSTSTMSFHSHSPPQRPDTYNYSRPSGPMLPLTLQDMIQGGDDASRRYNAAVSTEVSRRNFENRDRRGGLWRGRSFCPTGGCCGFARGRGPNGEKLPMTRREKWCTIGGIIVLSVIAITLGIVFAIVPLTSKKDKIDNKAIDKRAANDSTILPLREFTVRSYAAPDRLTTCISVPTLWSCVLPPDTSFPTTNASSTSTRVPEFRFSITNSSKTNALTYPPAPDSNDYALLKTLDSTTSQGELTNYSISLTTTAGAPETPVTIDGIIQPVSFMLPETVSFQPLRLFNRGKEDEHYGFHVYFDKTIQMGVADRMTDKEDKGGVEAGKSIMRVKWSETRFKVKIWTRKGIIDEDGLIKPNWDRENERVLPVEIWEDRRGGNEEKRNVQITQRAGKGEWRSSGGMVENKEDVGASGEGRGCYCRWANYKM